MHERHRALDVGACPQSNGTVCSAESTSRTLELWLLRGLEKELGFGARDPVRSQHRLSAAVSPREPRKRCARLG